MKQAFKPHSPQEAGVDDAPWIQARQAIEKAMLATLQHEPFCVACRQERLAPLRAHLLRMHQAVDTDSDTRVRRRLALALIPCTPEVLGHHADQGWALLYLEALDALKRAASARSST